MVQEIRDISLFKKMTTFWILEWDSIMVTRFYLGMLPQEIQTKIEPLSQENDFFFSAHKLRMFLKIQLKLLLDFYMSLRFKEVTYL